jgi:hypothetical protein
MSNIFALAGLNSNDFTYVQTAGQQIIYDAANTYFRMATEDMLRAYSFFIDTTTTKHTERFKLPGGGRLQERSQLTPSNPTRATGSWDTAYPIWDYGAAIMVDDIQFAKMTPGEFQLHMDSIIIQNNNTMRYRILYRILNNTDTSFLDPDWSTLTIKPLATGSTDGVLYPPVLGSEAEATAQGYVESNYAKTAIDDTNNPLETMKNYLRAHFGGTTGGYDIVVLINPAQTLLIKGLTDFRPVLDTHITPGANTDIPINLPSVPGNIIGRCSGCWVSEWDWMPDGWMVGRHMDAPAPLKMRVDPPELNLGQGLQLVTTEQRFPLMNSQWRHRFGIGTGNRLNGIVMELGTGGTYSVPAAYA